MIVLYRIISTVLMPLWILFIFFRASKGKEDKKRILERFGYYDTAAQSQNERVWLHAASVGECLVAITLINAIKKRYPKYDFLLTTGTVTSANIAAKRLSQDVIHQYITIDEYFCVKRFLAYWKPSIGLFIESEIWPNLVMLASRQCPIFLVNAIMSEKSFNRWTKYPTTAKVIFEKFTKILCQTELAASRYTELLETSTNVQYLGNLKFATPKPVVDEAEVAKLSQLIGNRPVILVASTHPGDEEIICDLHAIIKSKYHDILTIIAPRHSERANKICDVITAHNLTYRKRSTMEIIDSTTGVYLADTMGELPIFFTISSVTIIGGSFKNGGHNIIEPAFFDSPILFGPDMRNFSEISREFLNAKAAVQVSSVDELAQAVQSILDSGRSSLLPVNARSVVLKHAQIMDSYLHALHLSDS